MKLEILYKDDVLIAINKPHGLLVHRSNIAADVKQFALQTLRDQIGQKVFPIHRLDRKTSGVLLFALTQDMYKQMQGHFARKNVKKKYIAVVRGYSPKSGTIDYPLLNQDINKEQDAITYYKTLQYSEIDIPSAGFPTSRYSLLEVIPYTGRMHQIRKHFSHIRHPILCDRPYGCNKQNKLLKHQLGLTTMLLHAKELCFFHPLTGKEITIIAPFQDEFVKSLISLGFKKS